nr:hypothetical protein [Tanacetum cinerariifolium]
MTIETHNWTSSAHQELHKIVREENFPIVNQVDARVQNFKIQFLKEAAKFVGDFKSLANEADAPLAKHKALELEIERLLKAVVSQDIISVMQNASVVDTSVLQTELERFPAQSIRSYDAIALDLPYLLVFNTGASQSRQHVDISLIHIESRKPPTAELFDVDSGRISIHHCEY